MDWTKLWDVLDQISIIVGIIGIPALLVWFFAFYRDYSFQKKIKESLRQIGDLIPKGFSERQKWASEINSPNPLALCVSLLPDSRSASIKAEVKEFLKLKGGRFSKMKVKEINSDGIEPEKLDEFIGKLRKTRNEIDAMKVTEIHLFVAGPVAGSLLIGSQFEQWKPVKIYAKSQKTKQYEFWCLLEK